MTSPTLPPVDLNMNNFNIVSNVTPTGGNQFRIVFDAHDDSDTFISNTTTADLIHFESGGSGKLDITTTGLFLGDNIDVNTNDIVNTGNINFGSGSANSGRIRLPVNGSIEWESSPASDFHGEIDFDVDENFLFSVPEDGTFKFFEGDAVKIQIAEFNENGLNMQSNFVEFAERGDPVAPTNGGRFYVKDVGGISKPFFVGDGTAAVDLTAATGVQTPWAQDIDAATIFRCIDNCGCEVPIFSWTIMF